MFASAVTDPNGLFMVVNFGNLNDPSSDQQTGKSSGDIVGDAGNPGFLTRFDGTYVFYRVRLGAFDDNHGFPGVFWIGLDATSDGALDLFIGVNNHGGDSRIQFQAAGGGLNNSPSTTTIEGVEDGYSIDMDSSNYNYQVVSDSLQPGITNRDINKDGTKDAFLTIRVPFAGAAGTASLQGALAGVAGIHVDATSPFAYVIATSTQENSLNQDFGGIDNRSASFARNYMESGAMTRPVRLDGSSYAPATETPEPSTLLLAIGGVFVFASRVLKNRLSRG